MSVVDNDQDGIPSSAFDGESCIKAAIRYQQQYSFYEPYNMPPFCYEFKRPLTDCLSQNSECAPGFEQDKQTGTRQHDRSCDSDLSWDPYNHLFQGDHSPDFTRDGSQSSRQHSERLTTVCDLERFLSVWSRWFFECWITRVREALQLWQFNVGKRYMCTAFDLSPKIYILSTHDGMSLSVK